MVADRSLTLLPYIWRNFQPGSTAAGAYFSGTIRSAGGSVPDGVRVLRFWLVMGAEVWVDSPSEVRRWSDPQGAVTLEAYARDGPPWPPDKLVIAIVRISYQGQEFDLEAEPVAIQEAS